MLQTSLTNLGLETSLSPVDGLSTRGTPSSPDQTTHPGHQGLANIINKICGFDNVIQKLNVEVAA